MEPAEIRFVSDRTSLENEVNATFKFQVRLVEVNEKEVTVDFETMALENGASPGEDFIQTNGTLVFAPGDLVQEIDVDIVVDDQLEPDESFLVVLSNPVNGFLTGNKQEATGTILNDDLEFIITLPEEGYDTPHSPANPPEGMTLVWSDEFDGSSLDPANWVREIGGHGWGNEEAQSYTAEDDNAYVDEGNLLIVARENGSSYTSARLKSEDLQEFTHGRIDVRAVLPFGKALWPAIWMLGGNFNDSGIGWPRCGEIDIMELKGQQPNVVHGTAHWGKILNGGHPSSTGITYAENGTDFSQEYHVFSLDWTPDTMRWMVNCEVYRSFATTETLNHPPYNDPNEPGLYGVNPFNEPFFFILNVAVGGTFVGGYPDETTTFPQFMAVDYVRVYQ